MEVSHKVWHVYSGILCESSASPIIRGNVITQNETGPLPDWHYWGGGIASWYSSPIIEDNTIAENRAAYGGGIMCWGSSAMIVRNIVLKNEGYYGGGIGCFEEGPSPNVISGNIIMGNYAHHVYYGGGIYCQGASPIVENTTITGNTAPLGSGGGIAADENSHPVFENSILWDDAAATNNEVYLDETSSISVRCSDVQGGWPGTGNFSADPLFCDASTGDVTLRSDSPCLPGNHPDGYDCGLIGAFGEGCSGPTAVEETTWGGIKAMWK